MGRTHRPRKGSLGYAPRKRASRLVPRIRSWKCRQEMMIPGFPGYKVGMVTVLYVNQTKNSPNFGKEIVSAATVVETPPVTVFGVRRYEKTPYGLMCKGECWTPEVNKDLKRKLTIKRGINHSLDKLLQDLDEKAELRLLIHTLPRIAGIHKKKPEILEIPIRGGNIEDQRNYVEEKFGKTIGISEVFKPNQKIDVIGITKGKGFQGVIKRWGVKLLPHKAGKRKREVGSLGPWHPSRVLWTVPRPGQTGFHQRTQYNNLLLLIGKEGKYVLDSGEEQPITPSGGFPHYGIVKSDFVLIKGSVQGPPKRLVVLRGAIRGGRKENIQLTQIVHGH